MTKIKTGSLKRMYLKHTTEVKMLIVILKTKFLNFLI